MIEQSVSVMRRIRQPSTIQPKPCRCHRPFGDPRTGECVRCGRHSAGHKVKPPTIEESLFEMLYGND